MTDVRDRPSPKKVDRAEMVRINTDMLFRRFRLARLPTMMGSAADAAG